MTYVNNSCLGNVSDKCKHNNHYNHNNESIYYLWYNIFISRLPIIKQNVKFHTFLI